ncbi:MAG: NAD(P)H-binding protein [Coriobacteriia bacterium]|nr:NAD(P)H-binding protein [Coriobacteriia bacterium]
MNATTTVLLLGATGRTGGRVPQQLLDRGVDVRAIVRSSTRLPAAVVGNPHLTVTEADLLSLTDAELQRHVAGCDAVISCLGHRIDLKGLFGPPRDLVTRAVARTCRAIEAQRPAEPVKFVLMNTVAVNRPGGLDTRRSGIERGLLATMRALVPPAKDNQTAADHLAERIGTGNDSVRWVVVRPDTLCEGDVTPYVLHEGIVATLAKPDDTNMANVAHFMCELVEGAALFDTWAGKMPVIANAVAR